MTLFERRSLWSASSKEVPLSMQSSSQVAGLLLLVQTSSDGAIYGSPRGTRAGTWAR
jgi:hypothetical protein